MDSRKKELIRSIKFTLFSISAGVIQTVVFTLLNELTGEAAKEGESYGINYFVALFMSVLWNFTLNRKYTFQSANNVPIAMLKVLAFYIVFTPISLIAGVYIVNVYHWNKYLIFALTMLSNFVLEYLYDRFYVFGKTLDTSKCVKSREAEDRL